MPHWKPKNPQLLLMLSSLLVLLILPSEAFACTSKGPGSPRGCGGCNTAKIRQDASWLEFYRTVKSRGYHPVSCYRSYACQANLARTCGRGRASRPGSSNHERNIAMDFKPSQERAVRPIIQSVVKGYVGISPVSRAHPSFHISNARERGGHSISTQRRAAVEKYREEKRESAKRSNGDYYYNGCKIQCRPGKNGGWHQRPNGKWVKMMWECPL